MSGKANTERYTYQGIEFDPTWSGNFDEFKRQFEEVHVFSRIEPKKRLAVMKEVFNELVKHTSKKKPSEEAQKSE